MMNNMNVQYDVLGFPTFSENIKFELKLDNCWWSKALIKFIRSHLYFKKN